MQLINRTQIEGLRDKGHVVVIYPVTGIVCVDGFKYYKIVTVSTPLQGA